MHKQTFYAVTGAILSRKKLTIFDNLRLFGCRN